MSVIELKDEQLLCLKHIEGMVVSKGEGDSPIVARVSTEGLDSDGDIIRQGKNKQGQGWLLERFNRAPVMVWSHDIWMPNLAAPATKAKVGRDETHGRSLFVDPMVFDPGDEFAQHIEGKIRRGVIKEFSVSFIGKVWEYIRDKENDRPTGREFFEQELIEVSPVNRGANPDTEATAKRILGSSYVLRKVETAGDAEATEAVDELADVKAELAVLATALKSLGDQLDACQDEIAVLQESAYSAKRAYDRTAQEMLARLSKIGTAHE